MRSLILISKAVNTKRHALRKLIHNIIILILSIFIIAYFTGQFSSSRTVLMNLEHAKWDALITGSTFEQFNEKLNNANIKKVIGFNAPFWVELSIKGKTYNNNGYWYSTGRLYNSSFNDLYEMILTKETLLEYDKKLFDNKDSIFISYSLAKKMGAKVGDKITLKYMYESKDIENEFTIAALYDDYTYCIDELIVLYESLKHPIENYAFYSRLFISAYDQDKLINDLKECKNDYTLVNKYGMDWPNKATEKELSSLESAHFDLREAKINELQATNVFNPLSLVFTGISATLAICLLYINEMRKGFSTNRKSLGVLSTCGIRRLHIFIYSFIEATITLCSVFFIAILILLNFLFDAYTAFLFIQEISVLIAIMVAAIIVTAFIVSIASITMISNKKLLEALNEAE